MARAAVSSIRLVNPAIGRSIVRIASPGAMVWLLLRIFLRGTLPTLHLLLLHIVLRSFKVLPFQLIHIQIIIIIITSSTVIIVAVRNRSGSMRPRQMIIELSRTFGQLRGVGAFG